MLLVPRPGGGIIIISDSESFNCRKLLDICYFISFQDIIDGTSVGARLHRNIQCISSAWQWKSIMYLCLTSSRGSMYIVNKGGPKIDPCGTPQNQGGHSGTTERDLSDGYEMNHRATSPKPSRFSGG